MSLVAFSINLSGEADCEVRLSFSTSHRLNICMLATYLIFREV